MPSLVRIGPWSVITSNTFMCIKYLSALSSKIVRIVTLFKSLHFFLLIHCKAISRPIRTYFTRWLICTNSYDLTRTILYDLSKPQWRVGLGVRLGVGHSYKFIRIVQLVKYVRFSKNRMNLYEWGCTNSYELATLYNMHELPWDQAHTVMFQIIKHFGKLWY